MRERRKLLEQAAQIPHTLLFFESPHRIVKALEQLQEVLGDRTATVCRELTKRFEQIERGTLSRLIETLGQGTPRGEFCIVVQGHGKEEDGLQRAERLQEAMEELKRTEGKPLKETAGKIAKKYRLSRREVYQCALGQKEDPE
jgi:16S rRNA (cytidine1402-2'-O)-methyltransferase